MAFLLILFSALLFLCMSGTGVSADARDEVRAKMVLKPGSLTYDNWKSSPIPIYYSINIFNVTNAHEVLTNGSKPELQEVGPFVYLLKIEKTNITFNSNGTVTYLQKKTYHFMPEKSGNVSLNDRITHINPIVVAASSLIHNKFNDEDFLYYAIESSCNNSRANCSLFVEHNVSELLFDGYDDPVIKSASDVFPFLFSRFGYFLNRNNTPGADGVYNMFTGASDINKYGYLGQWNYKNHLGIYPIGSKCDTLDYTFAEDLPPYVLKNNTDPIYLFNAEVARSLRLDFNDEIEVKNISCKRYSGDHHLFNYDLDENKCYCLNKNGKLICPVNGMANASAGSFGLPMFISFPHFLYADPKLTKQVEGLHPNHEKHGFNLDIEPTLGIPIRANTKMQINLMVERNEKFSLLKDFPFKQLVIPQLWTAMSFEINDNISTELQNLIKVLPKL